MAFVFDGKGNLAVRLRNTPVKNVVKICSDGRSVRKCVKLLSSK